MKFFGRLFLFFILIFGSSLFGKDKIIDDTAIKNFSATQISHPAIGAVCTDKNGELSPASRHTIQVASDGEISAKITTGDNIAYYFQRGEHSEKLTQSSIKVKAGEKLFITFKSTKKAAWGGCAWKTATIHYKATLNFTLPATTHTCPAEEEINFIGVEQTIKKSAIVQVRPDNITRKNYLLKFEEDGFLDLKMLTKTSNDLNLGMITLLNGEKCENVKTSSIDSWAKKGYRVEYEKPVRVYKNKPVRIIIDSNEERKSGTLGFELDMAFTPTSLPPVDSDKCTRINANLATQTGNDNAVHLGKKLKDGSILNQYLQGISTKNIAGNHYLEIKADEEGTIKLNSKNNQMKYFISSSNANCAQSGDLGTNSYNIKKGESVFIGIKTPTNTSDTLDISFVSKNAPLPGGGKCTNGNDTRKNNPSVIYNFTNTHKAEIKTYNYSINVKNKLRDRVFYKYTVSKNGRLFIDLKNIGSGDEKVNLIRIDESGYTPIDQACTPNIFLQSGEKQSIQISDAKPGKTYWIVLDTLNNYNTDSTLPYILNATFVPEGVHDIPAPIHPDENKGNSGSDKDSKPLPPISGKIPKGDGVENLGNRFQIYEEQEFYLAYGGAGSYVNGDMLSIGNSVVDMRKTGYLYDGWFYNVNDDNSVTGHYPNSSRAVLQLPDQLKGNNVEIKWARLYWQGYISEARPGNDRVPGLIQGFRNINFKAGNDIYKHLSADSVNAVGSYNLHGGYTSAQDGLAFSYAASTDVTSIVKRYIESSNSNEFNFVGGNIATSVKQDYSIFTNRVNNTIDPNPTKLGRYGGWSLVVVYDVKRDVVDSKGQPYFKPKQVSVYNGYKLLMPKFSYHDTPSINIDLDGFYTPNSDSINAKITFLAFAGERLLASTDRSRKIDEGLYIWNAKKDEMHSFGTNAFQSSIFFQGTDGKYYDRDGGNNGNPVDGLDLNKPHGWNTFYSGMDLQVYQVGQFMNKKQTKTTMKLAIPGQPRAVDQSFVGMMGFSTDLYVPDLCYDDDIYNTKGWLGFFDKDGVRRGSPTAGIAPINDGAVVAGEQLFYRVLFKNRGPEDALGVFVTANLGGYNTYTTNSSQMDNTLKANNIKDANFVYLKDQEPGAWSDLKRTNPVNNNVYNNKQLVSYKDNTLRYFVGSGAGKVTLNSSAPSGGTIRGRSLDNVFVEYNATVGQYYKYVPPMYTAGFSVSDPTGTTTLAKFDYNTPLKRCTDKKRDISITLLNGLKVVNQNFQDKDNSQDERLYTQVAQKSFNANLIYKPDFSNLFECIEVNKDTGKCDKFNIPDDAKEFFDEKGNIKNGLQKFKLDGNLYISLIRAQDVGACKWLRYSDKLPFVVDGKRYMYDYKVDLYNKKIDNLKKLEVEDAFRGVSFMLSYYPTGLESSHAGESGVGGHGSYEEQFDKLTDEERKKIKEEIELAKLIFGTEPSADGSFHVCASDAFVTRPAYFKVNTSNFNKFTALINPDKPGDITQKDGEIYHSNLLRVGGEYKDNVDIAAGAVYAVSMKENGVPNYNAEIGGDLGNSGFSLKNGYEPNDKDGIDIKKKISKVKTYLKPFISKVCQNNIPIGVFYQKRDEITDRLEILDKPEILNNGTSYKYEKDIKNPNFGHITCSSDEKKQNGGKCFDEVNFRVWDKNKISLSAYFSAKEFTEKDGVINMTKWSADELRAQAIKTPNNKAKPSVVLSTSNLIDKKTTKNLGAIFNYFNVGDVMVGLYDNSWTEQFGDQLWSKDYNSASCILDSSTNEHNEKGMVGCDVGMKDNRYMLLRYQPDRVEIAMSGFGNTADNVKEVEIDGGKKTNVHYTYYNNPTLATINENGTDFTKFNKALISDMSNLARIEFDATAYLANANYKNVIPTLFDGQVIKGTHNGKDYSVPKCGFSSDIDVGLSFGFDCSINGDDERCSKGETPQAIATTKNYVPFPDLVGIAYEIPAGTQFFTREQCAKTPFDSRCFKYDEKYLVGAVEHQANGGARSQLSIPLNLAINFYSYANSDQIHNKKRSEKPVNNNEIMYDPKFPQYTLLKTGFVHGKSENAVAYFSFDRSFKSQNRPLLILGSDINIDSKNLKFDRNLETPSFNRDFELINTNGAKLNEPIFSGIPAINKSTSANPAMKLNTLNLEQYIRKENPKSKIDQKFIAKNGYFAHFVYGVINYLDNDGLVEGPKAGINVNIPSFIYCEQNDNCATMPFGIQTSIFKGLPLYKDGFVYNKLDVYNASNINEKFVYEYQPQDTQVRVTRANHTQDPAGQESVTFAKSQAANGVEIRVFTNPWFIYTPRETEILIGRKGSGINSLYNYFNVSFVNVGTWGGKGQIKGGKTGDVGQFIGGKDLEFSSKDKTLYNGQQRKNMRIEW